MKKIMILGGGKNQLPLIESSIELGYYTIVCDFTDSNPGNKICNKHFKINYMDYDAVLEIANNEKIDGIISNSEPAMINVSKIASELGLQGNSVDSVKSLLSKSRFREIQRQAGVFYPKYYTVKDCDELINLASKMKYPIIIKPRRSSGSRGTTKIEQFDINLIKNTYKKCSDISFDGYVSVEEYVEMKSLRVNDAEVFVLDGIVMWDGLFCQDRSKDKPMVPMTQIFPQCLSQEETCKLKEVITKIITEAGITFGELNVETYFNNQGDVFVIEINPRQGGNNIPLLIKEATGVDFNRLLVSTAVNDYTYYNQLKTFKRKQEYITLQVVFSKKYGIYKGLYIDACLKDKVTWIKEIAKYGDSIKPYEDASDALAFVNLKFDSYEQQHVILHSNIERYIYPIVESL